MYLPDPKPDQKVTFFIQGDDTVINCYRLGPLCAHSEQNLPGTKSFQHRRQRKTRIGLTIVSDQQRYSSQNTIPVRGRARKSLVRDRLGQCLDITHRTVGGHQGGVVIGCAF